MPLDAEREFEEALAELATRYLWIASAVLTFFYVLRSINYLFAFEAPASYWLAVPMIVSAAVCGAIFLYAKRGPLGQNTVAAATFVVGAILVFNGYWNLYVTQNELQLISVCFTLVCLGMITIYVWVWLVQVLVCLAVYIGSVYLMSEAPPSQFYAFVVMGLLLSFVAFQTRAPTIKERLRLEIQLRLEAEKLRLANAAKDRFVANMTHELRTPLTGVMGMMDLLEETTLNKDQSFMLGNAQRSAQYLLNIVNDILDFSKLEAGKLELKTRPVDLASVCHDAVAVFEASARDKGLTFKLEVPEGTCLVVEADGLRIGQILMNYIGNAIKFTDEGAVELRLDCDEQPEERIRARFSVTDTGAGIPPEKIDALFHRFEQVDDSATRGAAGTGLGLSICKELARLMGGTVGVESDEGIGSCFHFDVELPLSAETSVAAAPVTAVVPRDAGASVTFEQVEAPALIGKNGSPVKILLAEDNPINQIIISRMLELEGCDVTMVENGQEAVDAATADGADFDIVFLDVQMPTMDGISANNIIREETKNPPPIIAITANTHDDDIAKYSDAGMEAVLAKPLDRDKLREVLQKFARR